MKSFNPKLFSKWLFGFARRLLIISIAYIVLMLSIWTTLGQFFNTDTTEGFVLWIIIIASIILYVGFVIYVEIEQWKVRKNHD